jgi:hypothetical protein
VPDLENKRQAAVDEYLSARDRIRAVILDVEPDIDPVRLERMVSDAAERERWERDDWRKE